MKTNTVGRVVCPCLGPLFLFFPSFLLRVFVEFFLDLTLSNPVVSSSFWTASDIPAPQRPTTDLRRIVHPHFTHIHCDTRPLNDITCIEAHELAQEDQGRESLGRACARVKVMR